uniref:Uncharacterized protein n=1 Tax=Arundo donax TaxID=35708 RepID=A0A0A9AS73_ARUDO
MLVRGLRLLILGFACTGLLPRTDLIWMSQCGTL